MTPPIKPAEYIGFVDSPEFASSIPPNEMAAMLSGIKSKDAKGDSIYKRVEKIKGRVQSLIPNSASLEAHQIVDVAAAAASEEAGEIARKEEY